MKRVDVSKSYDDMISDLPDKDYRYTIIDLEFDTTKGRPNLKLVFISLNPDTASVSPKMLYSGSKEAINAAINGLDIHINATVNTRKEGTGMTEGEGIGGGVVPGRGVGGGGGGDRPRR